MPRWANKKADEGFTVIEIMIVIAIIGILAVISILQFSKYKQRSLDSAVETDLRNAATAQEAYFVDQKRYSNNIGQLTVSPYSLAISEDVSLRVASSSKSGYTMIAYHNKGNKTFTLAGPGGGITP